MMRALVLALVLALAGCGGDVGERPRTPDNSGGFLTLFPAYLYDDGALIDTTVWPHLVLWDTHAANLVAAPLSSFYYPPPGPGGPQFSEDLHIPRASFIGRWSDGHVVGDTLRMELAFFDQVPDSEVSDSTGFAVATWDSVPGFDVVRVRAHVTINTPRGVEPLLDSFYTLARRRPGREPIP